VALTSVTSQRNALKDHRDTLIFEATYRGVHAQALKREAGELEERINPVTAHTQDRHAVTLASDIAI
jgi:hypothetical protein